MTNGPILDAPALRARLAADIAAGRTVSLSAEDLAQPEVRRHLPQLLEELTGRAAPPSPLRVPGYTLLGEIGHGGMSTVWLARHETLQRPVALKIAPKWLAGDKRTQQRLLQEARAMARVPHPHIVAIHDILDVDDTVAIAMDWIDGRTLGELLAVLPPQPTERDLQLLRSVLGTPAEVPDFAASTMHFFVRAIRDVARAAHHVHAAGLLHLDIKPSNILVRRDGTALLSDFGVVREIALDATHTRTFAGTPVYAAPEQLQRQDAAFGAHTDVYALGMTLYELLARQQPLRQYDLTRVLRAVITGNLPPLGSLAPIAPDLAMVVHKAIAPEPGNRYPTAAAFADDLTAFLELRPVSARPLSAWQRLRRWARVEPWKATLAAALAVLLPWLGGLAYYVVVQTPRIERALADERRSEANQLKQAAFQTYFVQLGATGIASRRLQEAMAKDPGPVSLACLLTIMHAEGRPETRRLLAEHSDLVTAHEGLHLFATKVASNRAFFTADEVDRLRSSPAAVDKYVLALDRLLQAEDAGHEEAYQVADECLEEAVMTTNDDALLLGLRLWATHRTDRPERSAGIARTIRSRWPTDVAMLSWLYYTLEPVDRAAARAVAEEVRLIEPRHPASYEMLAGEALRRREPDVQACLAQIAAATAAAATSRRLDSLRLQALALGGGKPEAQQALREIPEDMLTELRRLRLLGTVDPAAATARRAELLATDDVSPTVLTAVYRNALRVRDLAHAEQAWQLWCRRFPDRRTLHLDRFEQLWEAGQYADATKLLADMSFTRRMPGVNWRVVCAALVTSRDWPQLHRHAARWHATASDEFRTEATYYVALAELRTGHRAAGLAHLTEVMLAPTPDALWFVSALLEDTWMRVHPDTPALLRNPKHALEQLPRLTQLMRERRVPIGPWASLVFAEVYFANDDRERAIGFAERGLNIRGRDRREKEAPEGVESMLREALERYRR